MLVVIIKLVWKVLFIILNINLKEMINNAKYIYVIYPLATSLHNASYYTACLEESEAHKSSSSALNLNKRNGQTAKENYRQPHFSDLKINV